MARKTLIPSHHADRVFGKVRGVTDTDCLRRFVELRDAEAFTALVQRHRPMVYRTCLARLGNHDHAQDATQQVFIKLYLAADRVTTNPQGWLRRCASNTAVSMMRSESARQRYHAALEPSDVYDADALEVQEVSRIVRECLAGLTEEDRALVQRHLIDGLTQSAIAREWGVSQQAVAKRLRRIKQTLSARFIQRGIASLGGLLIGAWVRRVAQAADPRVWLGSSPGAGALPGVTAPQVVKGTAAAAVVVVGAMTPVVRTEPMRETSYAVAADAGANDRDELAEGGDVMRHGHPRAGAFANPATSLRAASPSRLPAMPAPLSINHETTLVDAGAWLSVGSDDALGAGENTAGLGGPFNAIPIQHIMRLRTPAYLREPLMFSADTVQTLREYAAVRVLPEDADADAADGWRWREARRQREKRLELIGLKPHTLQRNGPWLVVRSGPQDSQAPLGTRVVWPWNSAERWRGHIKRMPESGGAYAGEFLIDSRGFFLPGWMTLKAINTPVVLPEHLRGQFLAYAGHTELPDRFHGLARLRSDRSASSIPLTAIGTAVSSGTLQIVTSDAPLPLETSADWGILDKMIAADSSLLSLDMQADLLRVDDVWFGEPAAFLPNDEPIDPLWVSVLPPHANDFVFSSLRSVPWGILSPLSPSDVSPVPEPATWLVLASGIGWFGVRRRSIPTGR